MIDTAGMRKSGKIYESLKNTLLAVPCVPLTVQCGDGHNTEEIFVGTTNVSQVLPMKRVKE